MYEFYIPMHAKTLICKHMQFRGAQIGELYLQYNIMGPAYGTIVNQICTKYHVIVYKAHVTFVPYYELC